MLSNQQLLTLIDVTVDHDSHKVVIKERGSDHYLSLNLTVTINNAIVFFKSIFTNEPNDAAAVLFALMHSNIQVSDLHEFLSSIEAPKIPGTVENWEDGTLGTDEIWVESVSPMDGLGDVINHHYELNKAVSNLISVINDVCRRQSIVIDNCITLMQRHLYSDHQDGVVKLYTIKDHKEMISFKMKSDNINQKEIYDKLARDAKKSNAVRQSVFRVLNVLTAYTPETVSTTGKRYMALTLGG